MLMKGRYTNFLVLDNMGRPCKIKVLTLKTFSLTKWYNNYTVNGLELTISTRLNNHEEERAKEVGYKEDEEWVGGQHNWFFIECDESGT